MQPPSETPHARRGLDYASLVFVSATPDHQKHVFDACISVGEELEGSWDWREAGRSIHFSRVYQHPTGCRVELTALGTDQGRNPGMTVLSLPGAAFYLQSTAEQMQMLWQLVNVSGFKWFSRLDFQNTELNPEWPVDRVHQAVEDGEVWVKGHRSWRHAGEIEADGSCPGGRTLYWGSPRSERQGRTYDKAKQLDWPVPAIRDEVQLRGDWAHSFGQELVLALRQNLTSDSMASAVERLTIAALTQHLQYMTLNGTEVAGNKNWTRTATPADWYEARIGKASEPLQKGVRDRLDYETSTSYGVQQYGRSFALWVQYHARRLDLDPRFVIEALYLRFHARLKDEDLVGLQLVETAEDLEAAREWMEELRNDHAVAAERGWWSR